VKSKLTGRARRLRKKLTDAESLLWQHLRGRQLEGIRFRRQQPWGNYIVDFASFEARIVVEVDGSQHATSASDRTRDRWLEQQGYRVLRFWNNDVLKNTVGVLETIRLSCLGHPPQACTSHQPRGESARVGLPARLATKANGGVLAKYVEAGRPSVTQQAKPHLVTQQMVGGECRPPPPVEGGGKRSSDEGGLDVACPDMNVPGGR
jgi:very-short-patch-repair endonuclease